jgi:pyocin large subunit-like protein
MSKQNSNDSEDRKPKQRLLSKVLYCVVVVAIILVVNVVTQNGNESDYLEDTTTTVTTMDEYIQDKDDEDDDLDLQEDSEPLEETEEELVEEGEEDTIEETDTPQSDYITYTFRNDNLLNSHYEKHGIEMGFASAEEYQASANEVINNPNALHKLEAEDNDDVYYLEDTQEFVIVSTDGYIRTYYYASLDYYNRQ